MEPQSDAIGFSQKSGKDLAKVKPADPLLVEARSTLAKVARPVAGLGKGTSKYWEGKVYQPIWRDDDGHRRKVSNYFVRLMVSGKREAVALNTADRYEAGRRAARLYEKIRTVGWESALKEFDPERHTPKSAGTVGDVIAAINRADMRSRTKRNYTNALRWFAARHIGLVSTKSTYGPEGSAAYRLKTDAIRLADLNHTSVRKIITSHIEAAGADVNAERSARIGAASYLRNAKAGLSVAELDGLQLAEPKPFAGIKKPEGATSPVYTSTIDAGRLVREAKRDLKTDPRAYVALLLAIGAGLRRGEILNLLWGRVDADKGRVLVLATSGWAPKTGESEQPVHVNAGLIAELQQFRGKDEEHVSSPAALDRTVSWLRSKGVTTRNPLHTLRKEFGSIINASSDLFTASKALRHSSIAVTAATYVENRKRVAPDIGAMLAAKPKQSHKNKTTSHEHTSRS